VQLVELHLNRVYIPLDYLRVLDWACLKPGGSFYFQPVKKRYNGQKTWIIGNKRPESIAAWKTAFRDKNPKLAKMENKTEKAATFGLGMSKSFCVFFVV